MKAVLTLIVASLLLAACGAPSAGAKVTVSAGSIGCAVTADGEEWNNCSNPLVDSTAGIIQDNPNGLGHQIGDHIRVVLVDGRTLWFPEDKVQSSK